MSIRQLRQRIPVIKLNITPKVRVSSIDVVAVSGGRTRRKRKRRKRHFYEPHN